MAEYTLREGDGLAESFSQWWNRFKGSLERAVDRVRLRWARFAWKRWHAAYERVVIFVPVVREVHEVLEVRETTVVSIPSAPPSAIPAAQAVCGSEVAALARYARQSVDVLEMGPYPKRTCKDAGLKTIGDLVSHTDGELRAMRCGFGQYAVESEIKPALKKIGLKLGLKEEVEALRSSRSP
ncbi:MAG TPA: hypothetical protein VJA27_00220 [Patescibacteria group bacterium]|nr:hypothetical protein [Patescibacteria group bacterium]